MTSTLDKDYRRIPCPMCGTVGTVQVKFTTSTFYCTHCGAESFDPWEDQPNQEPKPVQKKVIKGTVVPDPRPPLPSSPSIRDVVEDHYVPYDPQTGKDIIRPDGKKDRYLVSKVFCPKNTEIDNSVFDPATPAAQFYMKIHRKRFKNRRRYDRDLKRRKLPSETVG